MPAMLAIATQKSLLRKHFTQEVLQRVLTILFKMEVRKLKE
jgi:hypothetical protein